MTTDRPLLRGLFDVRSGLSGGMLELVYRLVFLVAAVPWAAVTVYAFQEWSVFWALVAGLVLGPALYVVLVAGMRIGLGFAVMLTKLMEQLSLMPAAVDRLSARVDELREDLGKSVDELTGHVESLPNAVGELNTHIDSLQTSLDSAQFWRSRGRRAARAASTEVRTERSAE